MDACKLAAAAGATYVSRYTVAQPMELKNAIKAGIQHVGFSFIEIVAPCPTQAGLYLHGSRDPVKSFNDLKEISVPLKKAESMSPEELENHIVIGNFVNVTGKPEYCTEVEKILAAQRED